ncbi:hypothetical protein [Bradyrhizobium cytisi]|uniref:Uncharacterized protein n=1 Tax=Bradyrhizobium cytisi TaxID=515489 RepID=A0A5S4W148_9BRAD|nr:hypothetical protein [Bradyrhizobium cytisi]TYL70687.1 hypothetical protein FXB38_41175 [Bradyrhizobium cytisi]
MDEIESSSCLDAAKAAEGGDARAQLANILRDQVIWSEAVKPWPVIGIRDKLAIQAKKLGIVVCSLDKGDA